MATGSEILELARRHVGERYVLGAIAPKNNSRWKGPWDCAEFVSWLVYQVSGRLYGCTDDAEDPDEADAYTGAWLRDARSIGTAIPLEQAAATPGAFVLRASSRTRRIGHVVVSDGAGGTVEAASARLGLITGSLHHRPWDTGILVPWIDYTHGTAKLVVKGPALVLRQGASGESVRKLQDALAASGFDPGAQDGLFGRLTRAAVLGFQFDRGLVPDGIVGVQTLAELGLRL